jgi:hypothetical protein
MILLAVFSTLTGALLAMRFKVFVLFPAMLVIVALNIHRGPQYCRPVASERTLAQCAFFDLEHHRTAAGLFHELLGDA